MDWQPIAEEYRAVFENYKITFDHAANLSKFYSGTVIITLAGLSSKVFTTNGLSILKTNKMWIVLLLVTLLAFGVLALIVLVNIIRARAGCIRRMNYLRENLLRNVSNFNYDEYLEVCGFKFDSKNLKTNSTTLAHTAFLLAILFFLFVITVWVAQW